MENQIKRGTTPPSQGGCWFCYNKTDDMEFDGEFDTYFHMNCLYNDLKRIIADAKPTIAESVIMADYYANFDNELAELLHKAKVYTDMHEFCTGAHIE